MFTCPAGRETSDGWSRGCHSARTCRDSHACSRLVQRILSSFSSSPFPFQPSNAERSRRVDLFLPGSSEFEAPARARALQDFHMLPIWKTSHVLHA
jgi:hypothetical protein